MGTTQSTPAGPDLAQGIPASDLPEGRMLAGHVGEEAVLLARSGAEIFAIGATCTHYGAPLADGLMVGDTVRCPWHHACFSLRTGEALHAPAFARVACWTVEQRKGRIFVRAKAKAAAPAQATRAPPGAGSPERIVIVGAGAAGFAAAEALRRQGYGGSLVMLSSEDALPVDRPNLSKDYLAGNAPEEWVPLRPESFYAEAGIDLRRKATVSDIDVRSRQITLSNGDNIAYDRLLLATGAEPVRLSIPGADQPHVLTLRSLADCRALIARAQTAKRAVVLGASFIGLEVAAALRSRGLEVQVVAPEARPMQRVLGAELGDLVTAARNMLGGHERFTAVPFFWSQHYDVSINYVGHAESWDEVVIEGDPAARNCLVRFKRGGRVLAVAAIHRDIASLQAELAMELQATS
jgi:apoptosis-inducing factor 3